MSDGTTTTAWRWDRNTDGVWSLWFDSPGRSHNVLDGPAIADLGQRLSEVEADPSCRGVLIHSAKPGGFCAGADLKTIQQCTKADELDAYLHGGLKVMLRLARLKQPTAAVVHGVCLGGGLELALACRFRVALASNVALQLGCPEVQHGLIPAWGSIERLPRLLAPRDALNLLLMGNPIGFLHAKSQGLVNRLVAQDEHDRVAEVLQREPPVDRLLEKETWPEELEFAAAKAEDQPADFPEAQQMIVQVIRTDLHQGREAAREAAVKGCVELAMSPATRQAIADFFQRRRSPA
jgi:3-hydroxyacyl-CoA dehydrogenase/enoyl-CoA hydratase/3-hydroxybutyryl-CoA epimerase